MAKSAAKEAPEDNPVLGVAVSDGILPAQAIRALSSAGALVLAEPLAQGQLQLASVDLRLGPKAYRVRASFLPGPASTSRPAVLTVARPRIGTCSRKNRSRQPGSIDTEPP